MDELRRREKASLRVRNGRRRVVFVAIGLGFVVEETEKYDEDDEVLAGIVDESIAGGEKEIQRRERP